MARSTDYDVIIIGAGVVGCAIARELSRHSLSILVLEKEEDVGRGNSCRNSGVVHPGFNVKPGSLKAQLNVEGAKLFPDLCRELDIPLEYVGTSVVATTDEELSELANLLEIGEKNGVPGLRLLSRNELSAVEPNIEAKAALHAETGAITCPYTLTIGLAENALQNGVGFEFLTEVKEIEKVGDRFTLLTSTGNYTARVVINSAGLFADRIAAMAGVDKYRVVPCRGEYFILDVEARPLINGMVYPVPAKSGGLGVHFTPTVDGNVLIGPNAIYEDDREDVTTSPAGFQELAKGAKRLLPAFDDGLIIGGFAGIRSKLAKGEYGLLDFVVEEEPPGFINLIGIESPGLTASPALAKYVTSLVDKRFGGLGKNNNFVPLRRSIARFSKLNDEAKAALIAENPDYGELVCRCENITKAEIVQALANPFGVHSLSAVKYRARAMMGRCQGGFCGPKIVEILEKEFGLDWPDLRLKGPGSNLVVGHTKDLRRSEPSGDARQPLLSGDLHC